MKRLGTTPRLAALLLGTAALTAAPAEAAGPNFSGNVYIDGSLCVGFDCVFGQAFGFDTIILKENNLRVFFDDTSTAGAFPRNDWALQANDSANGGASYLAIVDRTANREVFRVSAGARANALFVDSQGDVGIGTSTPATDIDIRIGDTPTVRLQQDGSSGFAPQTWDMAGNEAGFFIRDATNGSTLPFRIIPGASSNALVIDDDDDIGMGAGTNPTAPLHIKRSTGTPLDMARLENNEGVTIRMVDTAANGEEWTMQSNDGLFRIANPAVGGPEFTIDVNGNVTISGSLVTGGGGTCDPGPCDGVFDPAVYEVESIEEHAAFMWENKYLWGVGPTPEGAPINLTKKTTGILHELEKAHIYIEQLNTELRLQREEISELKALVTTR